MISQKETFYGCVLYRLVNDTKLNIRYSNDLSCYVVNDKVAIYVKYSTKRMTPWNFTFHKTHHDVIEELVKNYTLYIALICNDDGICCIDYNEYLQIIDFKNFDVNNISVQRKKRESYNVSGRLRSLPYKINDNDFPNRFLESGA